MSIAQHTTLANYKSTNVRPTNLTHRAIRMAMFAASTVAPGRTGRWSAEQFLTPRRRPAERYLVEPDAPAATLAVPDWPGLSARAWGRGPVVLAVHGWEGDHRQFGGFVAPLIERGYRVVAMDLPAHGASAGRQATIPEMGRAVAAVAAAVGPVHGVLAHSVGSAATALALADGANLGRVVFVAPPARAEVFVRGVAALLGLAPAGRRVMLDEVQRRAGVPFDGLDGPRLAASMTASALIVHDRDDPQVPAADGMAIAEAWPGARLHLVDGLGHNRILLDSGVVAAVTDFLSAPSATSEASR